MPSSINYKGLPATNEKCGDTALNAAVFLRASLQSVDPDKNGVLTAQEFSKMGLAGQKISKGFQAFKKNFLHLKIKKCVNSGTEFEKLIQQGEVLLKDLGFKCKFGFWTCSRPSIVKVKKVVTQPSLPSSSSIDSSDSKTPFKTKDDLENALYDQEIFKEKFSQFDAKRLDRNGYFPINLALIEVRKFLLQETDGNAALAVLRIREWLTIPALRNDLGIPNHARKKLRDILSRIAPTEDEVYNRGVRTILKAVKADYRIKKQTEAQSTGTASIPVVIIPQRSHIPNEFEIPFFPSNKKSKRVDTKQSFGRTYSELIRQSLITAFPIKFLKANLQVLIEPINGTIKKVVFTEVQVEGDGLDQKLVESILSGASFKLQRNYRFKKGVESLTGTVDFSR